MSFAYAKKAAAATTASTPTGWTLGWTFPSVDSATADQGPWPPGWPLESGSDTPDPIASEAAEAGTLSVVVTLPDTITIGSSITVEAETQNSSAASSILDNHLLKIEASDGTNTVQLKKTEGGTFVDAIFFLVENYTGSKYGIQETVFFDLTDPDDDEATITVTVTVASMDETLAGTDTMTANAPFVATMMLIAGGVNAKTDADLYTVSADTWAGTTDIPDNTTDGRMATVDSVGYLTGGDFSNRTTSFTSSTEAWAALATMAATRDTHQTWAIESNIYVAAGDGSTTTEEYSIGGDSWSSKATTSDARKGASFAPVGTVGYYFGGDIGSSNLATGQQYNQATNAYSATASLSDEKGEGVALTDGTDVWVTSGRDASGNNFTRTTEQYSVSGDSFSASTDHPTPGRGDIAAGWTDTDGFIMGDDRENDIFNFSAETWSAGTDIPNPSRVGPAGSGV